MKSEQLGVLPTKPKFYYLLVTFYLGSGTMVGFNQPASNKYTTYTIFNFTKGQDKVERIPVEARHVENTG